MDFAIAIHLVKNLENSLEDEIHCIASSDKDFEVVIDNVNAVYTHAFIKRVETLEEAMGRFFLFDIRDKQTLKISLDRQFGAEKADDIYRRLKDIFLPYQKISNEVGKKRSLLGKLLERRWHVSSN